jgi:hypothetical protein
LAQDGARGGRVRVHIELLGRGRLRDATPNPPSSFTFAALGDAPYDSLEVRRFRLVLREIEAHDLTWVLHIGDIFWRPCSDDQYRLALARFNSLRYPVIYTPGDNEWTDCLGACGEPGDRATLQCRRPLRSSASAASM